MSDDLRLKLKSFLRRAGLSQVPKPVLIALCACFLLLASFAVWRFMPSSNVFAGDDFQIVGQSQEETAQESPEVPATTGSILVDVEGAVKHPGLYAFEPGARVGDAIEAAGGLTKQARRGSVNLAAALEDGQQIKVPRKKSQSKTSADKSNADSQADGKINLNTATAQELQQLPGIGEALSQRIVDYRESNGPFSSVDDVTKVSGIGDARLAELRDKACV